MFAIFAAKRHVNGPVRAVSPVADNLGEINWKLASKQAKKQAFNEEAISPNSRKLIHYIQSSLSGRAAPESISVKESLQLFWVEAVSLMVPLLYISGVLGLFGFAILFFSEPMVAILTNQLRTDAEAIIRAYLLRWPNLGRSLYFREAGETGLVGDPDGAAADGGEFSCYLSTHGDVPAVACIEATPILCVDTVGSPDVGVTRLEQV